MAIKKWRVQVPGKELDCMYMYTQHLGMQQTCFIKDDKIYWLQKAKTRRVEFQLFCFSPSCSELT